MTVATTIRPAPTAKVDLYVLRSNGFDPYAAALKMVQEAPRVDRVLLDGPPAEALCFEMLSQCSNPMVDRFGV